MNLFLEPRLETRLRSVINAHDFLCDLVDALGSPLKVIVPEKIVENPGRFSTVYKRHRLSRDIFFAHKANRSSALVRQLADTKAGVDVASLGEPQHVLGAGFAPSRSWQQARRRRAACEGLT